MSFRLLCLAAAPLLLACSSVSNPGPYFDPLGPQTGNGSNDGQRPSPTGALPHAAGDSANVGGSADGALSTPWSAAFPSVQPWPSSSSVPDACAVEVGNTEGNGAPLWVIVGRSQAYDGSLAGTSHAGIEISGTLRWRFLDLDAEGALVLAPDEPANRGYLMKFGAESDLLLHQDAPYGYVHARLKGAGKTAIAVAIASPNEIDAAPFETLARTPAADDNGVSNHGDLGAGATCSFVGTWDVSVSGTEEEIASYDGVRTIAFDAQGRFVAYREANADLVNDRFQEAGTWSVEGDEVALISISGTIARCTRLPRRVGLGGAFDGCEAWQGSVFTDNCTGAGLFRGAARLRRRP